MKTKVDRLGRRILESDEHGPVVVSKPAAPGLKVGDKFRFEPGEGSVCEVVRVNDCAAYYRSTERKYVEPFETRSGVAVGDFIAKRTDVHAISRNSVVFREEVGLFE